MPTWAELNMKTGTMYAALQKEKETERQRDREKERKDANDKINNPMTRDISLEETQNINKRTVQLLFLESSQGNVAVIVGICIWKHFIYTPAFFTFYRSLFYLTLSFSSFSSCSSSQMPTFAPFSRVRSVRLPTFHRRSTSPKPVTSTSSEPRHTPRPRTISTPTANSFAETLRVISKEAQDGQFNDVFDAFFFTDKRCQNRAFFMAARLKQTLLPLLKPAPGQTHDALWKLITHRLYTFNYIMFVLPTTSEARIRLLQQLESQLIQHGDGQDIHRSGGMEVHFAVRYALQHKHNKQRCRRTLLGDAFEAESGRITQEPTEDMDHLVNRARQTLEHCLRSEAKLGPTERDAMYVFHGMRVGLHGSFNPRIELSSSESGLSQLLNQVVLEHQSMSTSEYVNPFEDDTCVVTEEDEVEEARRASFMTNGFYGSAQPTAVRYA
ncbi:hypothetical protein BDF14DRAFT_1795497 [Spinellus fusiger]|nr:hypothetical protein BDF14DRAFT_1795497 [Spinellus fusiger]